MGERNSVSMPEMVRTLRDRGVIIPCPGSVEIDEALDPEHIAPGVTIHTGCKILGAQTSIGPNSVIGAETPATVDQCQLGTGVSLKGGFFQGAVFLDGANMGSGAHVRAGTLLEEEANGAHTVGFKQTIFLSFVTGGSLLNFCDALMAGGTSRKNHSEIGSSYIHFNYTPHGDKATPSLIGDVPRGVMLDQPPIFLGGQGGLVGPTRIEYGCVIPAGVVYREDALHPGQLLVPHQQTSWGPRPYKMGVYRKIDRLARNNLIYIGNIRALKAWYMHARKRTMAADRFSVACHEGALGVLDMVIAERIKRLGGIAAKLESSIEWLSQQTMTDKATKTIGQLETFRKRWPDIEGALKEGPAENLGAAERDAFLSAWEKMDSANGHTSAVAQLDQESRGAGTAWLQKIVDETAGLWPAE